MSVSPPIIACPGTLTIGVEYRLPFKVSVARDVVKRAGRKGGRC